jgi:hypothetical protein
VEILAELAKQKGFVIPFVADHSNDTPLDLTMRHHDFKQTDALIKMLSKSPMDHHSRTIAHILPDLIVMNVPSLDKYFEKRRFQTGVCQQISVAKLDLQYDETYKIGTTTLVNSDKECVLEGISNPNAEEVPIHVDVLDLHLPNNGTNTNEYEIKIARAFANSKNLEVFQQKSVRAFIDFIWPKSREQIIQYVFLPYVAFIIYFMVYQMVEKKLISAQISDPTFFKFTSSMFKIYQIMFDFILFMGSFYFFYHDFMQIKSLPNNRISLWSWFNALPLISMLIIISWNMFVEKSPEMTLTFFSLTSFLIWLRVIHLLKLFKESA